MLESLHITNFQMTAMHFPDTSQHQLVMKCRYAFLDVLEASMLLLPSCM